MKIRPSFTRSYAHHLDAIARCSSTLTAYSTAASAGLRNSGRSDMSPEQFNKLKGGR